MRTSHARRPLHTQCELSRTNQGLLVAEMRFAAARAVTYAATAAEISSLDQGAARKWGGAKMAKWACRPVAASHPAGRQARRCARVEPVADRPFSASCHLVLFPQYIYLGQ